MQIHDRIQIHETRQMYERDVSKGEGIGGCIFRSEVSGGSEGVS